MIKISYFTAICVIFSVLFITTQAIAFEIGERSSSKTFRFIRVDGNYPPLEYIDENGKLAGTHIEKVDVAAKALRIKVNVESFPFLRCLDLMEKGEADAMFFLQKKPDREKYLHYFEGNIISKGGFVFLAKKGAKISFNGNLAEFFSAVKLVGVVKGYARPEILKTYESFFEESKDDETLVKKLIGNRFLAAIVTNLSAKSILEKIDKNEELEILPQPIDTFSIYLAFSKKINKSLAEQNKAKKLASQFAEKIKGH